MRTFVYGLLAGALLCTAHLNSAVEFFVAPGGNNNGPGTREQPFADLEAGRDAIRALKGKGSLAPGGVTVWIRGGTYLRKTSFELGAEDSGTSEARIVYRAVEHERVRLLGGVILGEPLAVSDQAVLERLDPAARAHVQRFDLSGISPDRIGSLHSRGFGRPTVAAHSELFYGGEPMTLARWPNEGSWEHITGFPQATGQGDEHGGKLGALEQGFYFASDRPERWKQLDDVWVHGYWAWDWANSYERVAALDLKQHWVKTAPPYGLYGFRKGQRFYFLNVLEELDQPGEWFLDHQARQLYFWPPRAGGEAVLSLLDAPLISMRGAAHVTFRGLTLEAARGHGIRIEGGTNDVVAGCVLQSLGNYGVWIDGGGGNRVTSCDIANTGDGGVNLSGGDRQTLTPGEHAVENCRFQKQGRWSKCYVPAVLVNGVGQRVAHNLIQDHPHCAILFNGNEHTIEFNEIHHVALETGDVGAIYTGRDWTFRGNRILYNFIHHTGGVGMGSMGVYMDDCVSGTEIRGNIFFKVSRAAFLGGGRDHRVENNIFVDCEPAVQLDGRGLDPSPVWHNMVYSYMRQQLNAVPRDLYRARYPALAQIDSYYAAGTNGIPPEGNVVARNISVGGHWLSVGWRARNDLLQLRDNYVGEDAGLVAPERMDFHLKKDSPALKLGFQPIPVEQIGLQESEFRHGGLCEAEQ